MSKGKWDDKKPNERYSRPIKFNAEPTVLQVLGAYAPSDFGSFVAPLHQEFLAIEFLGAIKNLNLRRFLTYSKPTEEFNWFTIFPVKR